MYFFFVELLKTLDPTCIPVLPAIVRTTGDLLFSNNGGNLSYTESTMIPVNHESSHMSVREAVIPLDTRNLQTRQPAEGNTIHRHRKQGY